MGIETAFVVAQAIPAHRLGTQLGGALAFLVVLLVVLALFRHVSRAAEVEHADELISERWARLESDEGE